MATSINIIFIIILNFVIFVICDLKSRKSRVYGGEPVGTFYGEKYQNVGSYPYVAALEVRKRHTCGAAIIKENVAITAAHCISPYDEKELLIRAGGLERGSKKTTVQISKISEIITHEDYMKEYELNNDIAILILESPFILGRFVNTIKLANIQERNSTFGQKVYALGWGRTNNNQRSERLLIGSMSLITADECLSFHKEWIFTNSMICAFDYNKKVTMASGDSGGPLVYIDDNNEAILIGISSYIIEELEEKVPNLNFPIVFTDIAALQPWITTMSIPKKQQVLNKIFLKKRKLS